MGLFDWIMKGGRVEKRTARIKTKEAVVDLEFNNVNGANFDDTADSNIQNFDAFDNLESFEDNQDGSYVDEDNVSGFKHSRANEKYSRDERRGLETGFNTARAASILFEKTENQVFGGDLEKNASNNNYESDNYNQHQAHDLEHNQNFNSFSSNSGPTMSYQSGSNFSSALNGQTYGNRNILVITPKTNVEVAQVVENLRNGDACIVCLEDMELTDAQRRLDFLSGVICAMKGSIKRLDSSKYVLTPSGIGVR